MVEVQTGDFIQKPEMISAVKVMSVNEVGDITLVNGQTFSAEEISIEDVLLESEVI